MSITTITKIPIYTPLYPAPPRLVSPTYDFVTLMARMKSRDKITLVGLDGKMHTGRIMGFACEGGDNIWLVKVLTDKETVEVCVKTL